MMFVASIPLNESIVSILRGRLKSDILCASPDSVADPYMSQGSHPDIVERVWDQLGKSLPTDCRCLIYGDPALVQPISGVILAFCLGTQYCLRLTPASMSQALDLGVKTSTKWASGRIIDATLAFGPDWVFGSWKKDELQWCREVYEAFNQPDLQ